MTTLVQVVLYVSPEHSQQLNGQLVYSCRGILVSARGVFEAAPFRLVMDHLRSVANGHDPLRRVRAPLPVP